MNKSAPWTAIRRALASESRIAGIPDSDRVAKSLVVGLSASDLDGETASMVAALLQELRAASVVGKLPAVVNIPEGASVIVESSGMSAGEVEEGEALAATRGEFTNAKLYAKRIGAIACISEDLLRFGGAPADNAVRTALSSALVRALDTAFLTSIATGATSIASTGDLALDVRALLVTTDADVLICGLGAARNFSTATDSDGRQLHPGVSPRGGTLYGLPVLVSHAPIPGVLLGVNSERVLEVWGGDSALDIRFGRQATLEMDDAPDSAIFTGSPSVPVEATQVSMFQTNSVAVRGIVNAGWSAQPGSVAIISDGEWYSEASPPELV